MEFVRAVIVGSGCSSSTPSLHCVLSSTPCATCLDAMQHPRTSKNHRLNPSLLMQLRHPCDGTVHNVLIDCGKTFRESAMKLFDTFAVHDLSAVLLTHGHADACYGIDDLREFLRDDVQAGLPVYADAKTYTRLQSAFPYLCTTEPRTSMGVCATTEKEEGEMEVSEQTEQTESVTSAAVPTHTPSPPPSSNEAVSDAYARMRRMFLRPGKTWVAALDWHIMQSYTVTWLQLSARASLERRAASVAQTPSTSVLGASNATGESVVPEGTANGDTVHMDKEDIKRNTREDRSNSSDGDNSINSSSAASITQSRVAGEDDDACRTAVTRDASRLSRSVAHIQPPATRQAWPVVCLPVLHGVNYYSNAFLFRIDSTPDLLRDSGIHSSSAKTNATPAPSLPRMLLYISDISHADEALYTRIAEAQRSLLTQDEREAHEMTGWPTSPLPLPLPLLPLEVLVLDMLSVQSYVSHLNVDQSIAVAQRLGARRTYFVGMSHTLEHHALVEELARRGVGDCMQPGYDGLVIAENEGR